MWSSAFDPISSVFSVFSFLTTWSEHALTLYLSVRVARVIVYFFDDLFHLKLRPEEGLVPKRLLNNWLFWLYFVTVYWKIKFGLKIQPNARGNYPILYHKTNKEASTVLCSVVKHLGSGRALKKWGKTLDHVSCFPLHFFRALPLPGCFTTEQSTVEASLVVNCYTPTFYSRPRNQRG